MGLNHHTIRKKAFKQFLTQISGLTALKRYNYYLTDSFFSTTIDVNICI